MSKKKTGPKPKVTVSDVPKLSDSWGNNPGPDATTNYEWICSKDPSFCMSIGDRFRNCLMCPYCVVEAECPGFNSIAAKYPEPLAIWEHVNNYDLADSDKITDDADTPVTT